MMDGILQAIIAQRALNNPLDVAKAAAATGTPPPAMNSQTLAGPMAEAQGTGDLASALNPTAPTAPGPMTQGPLSGLAGLHNPSTSPPPPTFPSAPATPRPSQPITPAATLLELLMKANQTGGQSMGMPTLGSLLGGR